MRPLTRYRIIIEDESHLTEVASGRVTAPMLCAAGIAFLALCLLVTGLLIAFTPLRTLLPGYLKESQRSATEERLLRLDSLMAAYDTKQAYIDNYLRVTDTDRTPGDSAAVVPADRELTSDSLLTATNAEQRFVSQMEEREKFNISVLAPLAAEGIMFSPVAADGIFTTDSHAAETGVVIIPADNSVLCAADGSVIALYHSPADRGYVIVIQHARGFITTYRGTGTALVGIGDSVNTGQAIALAPQPDARGVREIQVRMWHNGSPIIPYEYLGSPTQASGTEPISFDAPRGRL